MTGRRGRKLLSLLLVAVSVTRRFNFTVGSPVLTIAVSHLNTFNSGFQTWTLNADAVAGTNWLWSVGSLGTNSQIIIASPNSSYKNVNVKGGGSVRLDYNNLYAIAKIDGITVYSSCPPAFTVAPNPGVDNITVSTDNSATAKMSTGALIYKIKITDRLGTSRKLMEYKTPVKSINISINRLEAGIYFISMYNDTVWSTLKLIVK